MTVPRLAVLDLDNVVAPWWDQEDDILVTVVATLLRALPGDARTVAACTHRVARRLARLELGDALGHFERVRARPEAADRILLGALRDWAPPSPGVAWIASGDRRFAGACGRLRRAGHEVVVIAPLAGCSPQLRRRADQVLDLRRETAVEVVAA